MDIKSIDHLPFLNLDKLTELNISAVDVVDTIEYYIKAAGAGKVHHAPKSALSLSDGRYLMSTLCVADEPPLMAVKSLLVSRDNSALGLENINAAVILHDARTGVPQAVVDGNWVTAIRTAGLSGVAARHLAREDSAVVAFIGCGVQASSHLEIFNGLFPLTEVRALGRGAANRDRLLNEARQLGLKAVAVDDARSAIEGAQLVVTSLPVSFKGEPFIDADWVEPGTFCAITDLGLPWKPSSLPCFDAIVIDDLEQEKHMSTPLAPAHLVSGDITGLVSGAVAGRQDNQSRLAFIFRGFAVGDLALAALAWLRFKEQS